MVENFEIITAELSDEEKALVPVLIKGFCTHDENNPIKAPDIVSGVNKHLGKKVLSQPRLRKIVNFIRSDGILPLIATSNGYFVSHNEETVKSQIRSLKDRANGIMSAAVGLEKFLK